MNKKLVIELKDRLKEDQIALAESMFLHKGRRNAGSFYCDIIGTRKSGFRFTGGNLNACEAAATRAREICHALGWEAEYKRMEGYISVKITGLRDNGWEYEMCGLTPPPPPLPINMEIEVA